MARIALRLSPNRNARPAAPDMLVMHYTGMRSGEAAVARLCDPAARVSAHYVVGEDGAIVQLVPDEERAWHAGVSAWRGRQGLNDASIGIEIVNPGHEWGYRPFTGVQLRAVLALSQGLIARWNIPPWGIVGHSDVAPARKDDPGELFPWARFAAEGVGVWPSVHDEDAQGESGWGALGAIGYDLSAASAEDIVRAFQRRWLPAHLSGELDAPTRQRIGAVAAAFSRLGTAG